MNDDFEVNDDETLDVGRGDPKLVGFCSVCNAAPCRATEHYFGACPTCHGSDGYMNIGKAQWGYCKAHKVTWCFGINLLTSWRHETEEEQRAQYNDIGMGWFERISPYYSPEPLDNPAEEERG